MSDEGPYADGIPDGEIYAPALFAVHNDLKTDGRLQFVERSYLLPLIDQYELPGSARVVLVDA